MIGPDNTIRDAFDKAEEMNAGLVKLVATDEDEEATAVAVFALGKPEAGEVAAAIEAVDAAWQDERPVPDVEEMLQMLDEAYDRFGAQERSPGLNWVERYHRLKGDHRVLVENDYHKGWVSPEDAEAYCPEERLREINAPAD